jgi:hypothetical protein
MHISLSTELNEEIQNNKLANANDIHEIVNYSSYFLPSNKYISVTDLCGDNGQTIGNYSVNGDLPFHVKEYPGELGSYYSPFISSEFTNSNMVSYFYEPIISYNTETNRVKVELKSKGNIPTSWSYSSFWADINMCETSTVTCPLASGVLYENYSFTGSKSKDIIITTGCTGSGSAYPEFKIIIDTNELLRSDKAYKFIILTTKKTLKSTGAADNFNVVFEFNIYEEQNIMLDYSNKNRIPRLRDVYFSTEKQIRVETGFMPAGSLVNVNLGEMELWQRSGTTNMNVMDASYSGFFAGTFNTTMGPTTVNSIVNEYYTGITSSFQIGDCLLYGNSGGSYNYVLKFPNLKATSLSYPDSDISESFNVYYSILYSNGASTGFTTISLSPYVNTHNNGISSKDLISGKGIYLGSLIEIMNIDAIKIVLRPTGTGGISGDNVTNPSRNSFPYRRFYNYLNEPLYRSSVPI